MDFATLKTDVTTWVTNNKIATAVISIATVGGIVLLVKNINKKKALPSKPRALLNGVKKTTHKKKKYPRKIGLQGLK